MQPANADYQVCACGVTLGTNIPEEKETLSEICYQMGGYHFSEISRRDINGVRHLSHRCPYIIITVAQWRCTLNTVS